MDTVKNTTVFLYTQYFTSDHSSHQMCRGFPHTSISATLAGCPIIYLNSDITYLETESNPQVEDSVVEDYPHHHFRCQSQVQAVTCMSEQLAVNQRFP